MLKVYVGNLPKETTDAQLNELALPYGTPESANVVTDRATGAGRGFGFLHFTDDAQGHAAIAGLNQKEVNGQVLTVNEARPQKAR